MACKRRRAAAALAAFGLLGSWEVARAETVDRIVAVVNDEVVTASDLHAKHLELQAQGFRELEELSPSDARRAVLRRLLEERVMLQEARRLGLTVAADEVAAELRAAHAQAGSPDAFQAQLKRLRLTEARYSQRIREELTIQRLIDAAVRSAITLTPQEIASASGGGSTGGSTGDRLRLRHLLVRVGPRPEQTARQEIERLRQALLGGADFATVATQSSEDPYAPQGGAMGWVRPDELLPELAEAASTLPVGELSTPIRTALGFHLLWVEERGTGGGTGTPDGPREAARRLYQEKFEAKFREWLEGLMDDAYIELQGL